MSGYETVRRGQLRVGDVIVPWEADRDPQLLAICGMWSVVDVDLDPGLGGAFVNVVVEQRGRKQQTRSPRKEPVKIRTRR